MEGASIPCHFGIAGALIVCFDIWRFKQANSSETGFGGHHCDFEQHVPCLIVHVCINSVKFVLEAPGAPILWERYYYVTMCRLPWRALLLGRALVIETLRYFLIWKLLYSNHTFTLRPCWVITQFKPSCHWNHTPMANALERRQSCWHLSQIIKIPDPLTMTAQGYPMT